MFLEGIGHLQKLLQYFCETGTNELSFSKDVPAIQIDLGLDTDDFGKGNTFEASNFLFVVESLILVNDRSKNNKSTHEKLRIKHHRGIGGIIIDGGCFQHVIDSFRMSLNSSNSAMNHQKSSQHAVGLRFHLTSLFQMLFKDEVEMKTSVVSKESISQILKEEVPQVLVVSCGKNNKENLTAGGKDGSPLLWSSREVMATTRLLQDNGIRASFLWNQLISGRHSNFSRINDHLQESQVKELCRRFGISAIIFVPVSKEKSYSISLLARDGHGKISETDITTDRSNVLPSILKHISPWCSSLSLLTPKEATTSSSMQSSPLTSSTLTSTAKSTNVNATLTSRRSFNESVTEKDGSIAKGVKTVSSSSDTLLASSSVKTHPVSNEEFRPFNVFLILSDSSMQASTSTKALSQARDKKGLQNQIKRSLLKSIESSLREIFFLKENAIKFLTTLPNSSSSEVISLQLVAIDMPFVALKQLTLLFLKHSNSHELMKEIDNAPSFANYRRQIKYVHHELSQLFKSGLCCSGGSGGNISNPSGNHANIETTNNSGSNVGSVSTPGKKFSLRIFFFSILDSQFDILTINSDFFQ